MIPAHVIEDWRQNGRSEEWIEGRKQALSQDVSRQLTKSRQRLALKVRRERERVYCAALELVRRIDQNLTAGRVYRDVEGNPLWSLDQVVRAILEDRLEGTA